MSEQFETNISGPTGPVHPGSGDQHIHYHSLLKDSDGRTPRTVAADQLRWLHARFVEPSGFGKALTVLQAENIVLLEGVPGCGRSATARVLLLRLPDGASATIQEVVTESDRDPERHRLKPKSIGDGARMLLDLSAGDERQWSQIHDDIPSFQKTVMDRGAHLVVVLPPGKVEQLRTELVPHVVGIVAPPRPHVFQRYLRQDGIPASETIEPVPALSDYLDKGPPLREVAELARLIIRARNEPTGDGGFASWCESALKAFTNRSLKVDEKVAALSQGPQRALLVTAALLHEAHADAVHDATTALLKTVDYPQDETPSLERADLFTRLNEIGAVRESSGKVRFTTLGYDAAVRTHFWDHMPGLRDPLGSWVGRIVSLESLTVHDRDMLVERFTEQCLRDIKHRQILPGLILKWTSGRADTHQLRAAAHALAEGLDTEHGRFFRHTIYDWSKEADLSDGLRQVLVEVCAEVMAVHHPDQAMVRLHHLARRERGAARARQALLELAGADQRLHRLMLHRVTRHTADKLWQADIELFLELAHPDSLIDRSAHGCGLITEPGLYDRLTCGWYRAFQQHSHGIHEPFPVQSWLEAAGHEEEHRDLLLDVLVSACARDPRLLSQLYVTTRDWAHHSRAQREARAPINALMLRKINSDLEVRKAP